ncbi:MAG: hypothetical protein PHS59_18100, partial [Paludibacter sp.]|nr:hypothetical protein [Paludibacter sp.]
MSKLAFLSQNSSPVILKIFAHHVGVVGGFLKVVFVFLLFAIVLFVAEFMFTEILSSLFFGWVLTTEAMGIWRFAGAFAVVERQSECGSKDREMHVSQPMNIGVC